MGFILLWFCLQVQWKKQKPTGMFLKQTYIKNGNEKTVKCKLGKKNVHKVFAVMLPAPCVVYII